MQLLWLYVKTSGKVLTDDQQCRITAIASCIHAKEDLRNMSFMNEDGLVNYIFFIQILNH